ncbi:MAG: helix-turn-helix transcriptional regulator [Clostridia bacterium]|nr:helix-turn-helix transcriptional regulator [Clostridia bacterium]
MEFKDKVKFVRKKLYLSQEMMAKELGVAFATVNRWEAGRCHPNYRAQRAFADFCKANGIDAENIEA